VLGITIDDIQNMTLIKKDSSFFFRTKNDNIFSNYYKTNEA